MVIVRIAQLVLAVEHLTSRSKAKALALNFFLVDGEAFAEVIFGWHLRVKLIQLLSQLGEIGLFTFLTRRLIVRYLPEQTLLAPGQREALVDLRRVVPVLLVAQARRSRRVKALMLAETTAALRF